jgi:hypothetical protein
MVTDHISVVFPDNRVTSTRTAFAYHMVTFGRCSYARVTQAAVSAGLSLHLDAVIGASAYVEEEFQAALSLMEKLTDFVTYTATD